MKKRSISDGEIALIKAMLARGMKNKDIQFFFNRPNRPVNSGRISTIASGSYSNSAEIDAASDHELDKFTSSITTIGIDGSSGSNLSTAPTFTSLVRALFGRSGDGRWQLAGGENELRECKQQFDGKRMGPVIRAVAAMANNKGGYILFGISNDGYY